MNTNTKRKPNPVRLNDNDSSETMTMLLTYMFHLDLPVAERALKIRKCAKAIHRRTKSKVLKEAMHNIRDNKNDELTLKAIKEVHDVWFRDFHVPSED